MKQTSSLDKNISLINDGYAKHIFIKEIRSENVMNKILSLIIKENHPAYSWAKQQSDSVNAIGHIGTHIDCYTRTPKESNYKLKVLVIDCRAGMPDVNDLSEYTITDKALILYTGVCDKYGYGTKEYGNAETFLSEESLILILSQKPKFILIDGCGIGKHGEEHIKFDKKCEENDCFVIENILLTKEIVDNIKEVDISIELEYNSTGKPCKVISIN